MLIAVITCDTSDWPPPSNGQMATPCRGKSQVSYGTHCLVTCNHGFEIVGNQSSLCDINGSWNPKTTANCRGQGSIQAVGMCFALKKINQNMMMEFRDFKIDCTLVFFVVVFQSTLPVFVISVRACPPLVAPDNGQIIPEICKIKPLHGQNCSYECSSGFARFGSFSNMCDNGRWTQGIFHCKGKLYKIIIHPNLV